MMESRSNNTNKFNPQEPADNITLYIFVQIIQINSILKNSFSYTIPTDWVQIIQINSILKNHIHLSILGKDVQIIQINSILKNCILLV